MQKTLHLSNKPREVLCVAVADGTRAKIEAKAKELKMRFSEVIRHAINAFVDSQD